MTVIIYSLILNFAKIASCCPILWLFYKMTKIQTSSQEDHHRNVTLNLSKEWMCEVKRDNLINAGLRGVYNNLGVSEWIECVHPTGICWGNYVLKINYHLYPGVKMGKKPLAVFFSSFWGSIHIVAHLAHFCFVAMCNFYQNKRGLT